MPAKLDEKIVPWLKLRLYKILDKNIIQEDADEKETRCFHDLKLHGFFLFPSGLSPFNINAYFFSHTTSLNLIIKMFIAR